MLTDAGVDWVFTPSVEEMYPEGYSTYVEVRGVTQRLEGEMRPGHFLGVATVVAKLFNIVQPTRAYFGQKDAQQVAVMRKMVRRPGVPFATGRRSRPSASLTAWPCRPATSTLHQMSGRPPSASTGRSAPPALSGDGRAPWERPPRHHAGRSLHRATCPPRLRKRGRPHHPARTGRLRHRHRGVGLSRCSHRQNPSDRQLCARGCVNVLWSLCSL